MELRGRRAVITGGASGIGRGLAEAFVAAGAAEVVIADLDTDRVAAVAERIGAVPATVDTASAAGLLTNLGLLPYSVTKHAAVGVAEWLAITYGDDGIRVSCLCPQLVDTPLVEAIKSEPRVERAMAAAGELLSPADVAAVVVDAIGREEFLILPHPEVRDHATRRAAENERWMRGMRRLWASAR